MTVKIMVGHQSVEIELVYVSFFILICFLQVTSSHETHFFMRRIKSARFDIDESSWNYDISSSIVSLLEMIPEDDKEIDVPTILYKAFSTNVLLLLFDFYY